jgi:hypothetical protein
MTNEAACADDHSTEDHLADPITAVLDEDHLDEIATLFRVDKSEFGFDLDLTAGVAVIMEVPPIFAAAGLMAGSQCIVAQGEPGYATIEAFDKGEQIPTLGIPLPWVFSNGIVELEFLIELFEATATVGPLPVAADRGDTNARIDAVSLEALVRQSLNDRNVDVARCVLAHQEENAKTIERESECTDLEPSANLPKVAQPEAGVPQPVWQGDSYAPADGERALPRFQLVEERACSDRRPWFISTERSQFERDMVAKAAREATSRSAIDPNYHPYRATEI